MFVAYRQFASASGTEELKEVPVRLPSGAEIAPDGTTVYPAKVWTVGARAELLVLPGYYASTDGNIWSRNQGGTLKKISPNRNLQVCLYVGVGEQRKQRAFLVYRIVASTFLSGIRHSGQTEADHIDVQRQNGALANLRWATKKQNAANKCPTKKKATAEKVGELSSKPVQQLDKDGNVIAEFPSLVAAAAALGLSKNAISNCVTGRRKTAGGFAWRLSPPETTLDEFRSRGVEVVGGLEEAPSFYFSNDLKVYNDKIGKMYEIPINHGRVYPTIKIGKSLRFVHVVVAALRMNHESLATFDAFLVSKNFVVMHDDDADKGDWWNCRVGTRSENGLDAVRNGCTAAGKSAPRPVVIRRSPDLAAEVWKYDGGREAAFSSFAEAARALAKHSPLKGLHANIAQSAYTGCYFSLVGGAKAWAFAR
jgi:hypothetical protein